MPENRMLDIAGRQDDVAVVESVIGGSLENLICPALFVISNKSLNRN